MPPLDLYSLLFETVLRIDPTTLSRYTTIQDQLLWLVLIPHVILLLFLLGFGRGIAGGHKGLAFVISIVAYLFFIWGGWYGSFLVPILGTFWYILLGIGLFLFFVSRIIHPATAGAMIGLAAKVGEKIGAKTVGAVAEKRELQKALAVAKHEVGTLQSQLAAISVAAMTNTAAKMQADMLSIRIAEKQAEIAAIEAKLRA